MKKWFLLSFLGIFTLIGCKEREEFEAISTLLSQQKLAVESIYEKTPYSEKEHQAIANYFRGAVKYAKNLKSLVDKNLSPSRVTIRQTAPAFINKDRLSRLQEALASLCETAILPHKTWKLIAESCEVSGYFVCNEEVRVFPDIVQKLLSYSDEIVEENPLGETCSQWSEVLKGD